MPEVAGLHYELTGPEGAPALILASGLGGSASYWAPNLAALAERFRVISFDQRGTGRSDRALDDASLRAIGGDMLTVLDAVGAEKAHVMGHAIGGMAGLELARMAPERVDRLVIINGWAKLDHQTERCFDARLAILGGGGPRAYLEAQPLFLYPTGWLSENDGRLRAESLLQAGHWPGDATIKARIAAARAFDCVGWAKDLSCSVLLVSAADDLLVPPACSARLAALIGERATSLSYPWGAHAVNVTAPDPFNRDVLAWLLARTPPIRSK